MKKIRRVATMPPCARLACVLLFFLFGRGVLTVCPPTCSCIHGHREVDCSGHGLGQLPDSLQHNIHTLNLSHNHLQDLDGRLSRFAHLRTLDISHNRLARLPAALPRALWDIRAAGNRLRQLEKNDTAVHWNLRELDLSANELERVVFINNTLPSLRSLNLSHNKFWTVPTNMPSSLEVVDLSHNFLVQILPGSLERLTRLSRFFLHSNRFTVLSERAFVRLEGLRLITLYDNPWACEDEDNIAALQVWMQQTFARVLGCPCSTRHICGEAHLASTRAAHFASYTQGPVGADAREGNRPPMQAVTSGHLSRNGSASAEPPSPAEQAQVSVRSSAGPRVHSTQTSTTGRPRSPKAASSGSARSTCPGLRARATHAVAAAAAAAVSLVVVTLRVF